MLSDGRFQGMIGGKSLIDYKKMIDWNINDENERLKLINEILNLDDIGSNDEFWQKIWDCGICKSNLDKTSARWDETNVSRFLETIGNYFIYGCEKKEKVKSKDLELFETMTLEDINTDKNYRLAPPEKIDKSDFRMRELFAGTYEDYVEKVNKTIYKAKSRETWERIKYNEEEKIRFLTDAQRNLDILKQQMEDMKEGGTLQFNKIIVAKVSNKNIEIRLSKQLERYGLDNEIIIGLEEDIYKEKNRATDVKLFHLTNNIKDIKDYMIMCKLSYMNRVMIKPKKCPTSYDILEKVDYLDETHIKAMLSLGKSKLDPSKNISVIANDINKKIKEMYSNGELSDRDMYIIEGLQYNVPYETLAKELNIKLQSVEKAITRISNNIVKSFYNDHMDLYFLNESKGKYKTCSRCGETKLISRFDKEKKGKYGVKGRCKECFKK